MLVTNGDRKSAYTAIINLLLKDPRIYCNNCGMSYWPDKPICCADPQIGTNYAVVQAVIKEVRELRENAKNNHASFAKGSMRLGLRIPPFIYEALENYEKSHGRKLIESDKDIKWLMKNFPMFCVPRSI
jgi:hypothetical protein